MHAPGGRGFTGSPVPQLSGRAPDSELLDMSSPCRAGNTRPDWLLPHWSGREPLNPLPDRLSSLRLPKAPTVPHAAGKVPARRPQSFMTDRIYFIKTDLIDCTSFQSSAKTQFMFAPSLAKAH